MPARPAIPAKNRDVVEYPLESTQTFEKGAPVILDANEEITEAGADPAAILGFALHPAKDPDGNNRSIRPNHVLVALAKPEATFWLEGTVAPSEDHLGNAFGIVKDGDGIWTVDISETTNTCFIVKTIDEDLGLFEVAVEADTIVVGG